MRPTRLLWCLPLTIAAACARTPPAASPTPAQSAASTPPAASIEIRVASDASMRAVTGQLDRAATDAGMTGECAFVWGALASADGARAMTIVFGAEVRMTGWAICGGALEPVLGDSKEHDLALLRWYGGRLLVAHPSDTSASSPAPPLDTKPGRPPSGVALYTPSEDDTERAAMVLPELRHATRVFSLVVWPFR